MGFNWPDAPTIGQVFQGWIWDGEKWDGIAPVPGPATASPIMNGAVAVGTSLKYAREDHIHPTDTAINLKVARAGDTMTGPLNLTALVFPATQVSSSNVNTLDDYEEGSFTPGFNFGGNTFDGTYAAGNLGYYTKVGRIVTICASVRLATKGTTTGQARISLGTAPTTDGNKAGGHVAFYSGMTGLTGALMLGINTVTADISLSQSGAATSALLTDTAVTASMRIDFSLVYQTAT